MSDKVRNLLSNELSPSFKEETANPTEKAVEDALKIYKETIMMELGFVDQV